MALRHLNQFSLHSLTLLASRAVPPEMLNHHISKVLLQTSIREHSFLSLCFTNYCSKECNWKRRAFHRCCLSMVRQPRIKDEAQAEADAVLRSQSLTKLAGFTIRLLDEHGDDLGVMKRSVADNRAKEDNLKLVCVNEKETPQIFQLMTSEQLVQHNKNQRKLRKEKIVKEKKNVRLTTSTGERDRDIKLRQVSDWLAKGHNVQILFKSGKRISQDEIDNFQHKMFVDLTNRYEEISTVKEASRTEKDLRVILTPKPSALPKELDDSV